MITIKFIMKEKIVFALLMGVITTGIISFSLIGINLGFTNNFISIWLKSWVLAYVIVIPAILFIGPKVQKLSDKIVKGKMKKLFNNFMVLNQKRALMSRFL
jgi:hypothetical protein